MEQISQVDKPATLKSRPWKEWVRIQFLSPHIWSLPKDKEILDLACGWGFAFKINPNLNAVEYDIDCVNELQRQGFKVKRGNILEELPFPENSMDVVFSHDVLEHFERAETEVIFEKVKKCLKPGGLFINVVPNKLGYEYGVRIEVGHKYFIQPKDIEQIAKSKGYIYKGYYHSPFPQLFDFFYKHNKRVITCQLPK